MELRAANSRTHFFLHNSKSVAQWSWTLLPLTHSIVIVEANGATNVKHVQ